MTLFTMIVTFGSIFGGLALMLWLAYRQNVGK
jgi:hypothetical protein